MCNFDIIYPPYGKKTPTSDVVRLPNSMPSYPWPKPLNDGAGIMRALRLWLAEPDSLEERRERLATVEQMIKSLNG